MSIFPVTQTGTVTAVAENVIKDRGTNFLFDFSTNQFVVKDGKLVEVVGDAAVVFWIEKTIRTDYERAAVYQNTGYGFGIDKYVGQVLPKAIATLQLQDGLKDALYKHQRIKSIYDFTFEQLDDAVSITFKVELNPVTDTDTDDLTEEDASFTRLSTVAEINEFLSAKLITANLLEFQTSIGGSVILSV